MKEQDYEDRLLLLRYLFVKGQQIIGLQFGLPILEDNLANVLLILVVAASLEVFQRTRNRKPGKVKRAVSLVYALIVPADLICGKRVSVYQFLDGGSPEFMVQLVDNHVFAQEQDSPLHHGFMREAVPEFGQKAAFAEDAVEGAGHRYALRDVCELRDEANDVETQLLLGLILEEVIGVSDGDGRTLGPLQ